MENVVVKGILVLPQQRLPIHQGHLHTGTTKVGESNVTKHYLSQFQKGNPRRTVIEIPIR